MFQLKSNLKCKKCNKVKYNFENNHMFDFPLSLCKMVKVDIYFYKLPLKLLEVQHIEIRYLSPNYDISFKNYISNNESPHSTLKHLKIKIGNTLYNNFTIINNMLRNYILLKTISYLTFKIKNELSANKYFELIWKIIKSLLYAENIPKNLINKCKIILQ